MVGSASPNPPGVTLIISIYLMLGSLYTLCNARKIVAQSRTEANKWKIFKGMWDLPGQELMMRVLGFLGLIVGLLGTITGSSELIPGTHRPQSTPARSEQAIPNDKETHSPPIRPDHG